MKVFKKLTAFVVAMTMGCSVVSLAACNLGGNGDNSGDDGNGGQINTPATAAATLTTALKEQKEYLSVSYNNKISGTEKHTTKTNDVVTETETTTYKINLTANGKVDLKKGDADLVATSKATYESTDKDKDFTQKLADNNYTEYNFLRSWNMFSYSAEEEVTDFSGVELVHAGSANLNWEEILGQIGSVGGGSATTYAEDSTPAFDLSVLPTTSDLAKLSLPTGNVAIVNLAAATDTLKYENGVYSIDLIKTAETVIKEFGSVVSSLKGETTVGDILNDATVKKYLSAVTELVPVETVKTTVSTVIDNLSKVDNEYVEGLLLYIQQDLDAIKTIEASTTYDYIVSLIGSESLLNIANTVMMLVQSQGETTAAESSEENKPNAFFTKTLDKYSVDEIIEIVNTMAELENPITLQFVQNAYKKYVESICDGEKLVFGENSALTVLNVEYKLENGKIASQKANYAFENKYSYKGNSITIDGVTTSSTTDKTEKQEIAVEVTYDASAPALKNVNANTVAYYVYEWLEDDLDDFYLYDENYNGVCFYVGAKVVDGQYAGYRVYDANKHLVVEGSNVFSVGNDQYSVVEDRVYIGQSYSYVDLIVQKVVDGEGHNYHYPRLTTKQVKHTSTVAEIIEAKA